MGIRVLTLVQENMVGLMIINGLMKKPKIIIGIGKHVSMRQRSIKIQQSLLEKP